MSFKLNYQARLNLIATLCLVAIIGLGGYAAYLTRLNADLLKFNHQVDIAPAVLISDLISHSAESASLLQTASENANLSATDGSASIQASHLKQAGNLIARLQKNIETTKGLLAQLEQALRDPDLKAKAERLNKQYADITSAQTLPVAAELVSDSNTGAINQLNRALKQQDQHLQQAKELQRQIIDSLKISQLEIDQDSQRNIALAICLASIITIVIAVFLLMSRLLTVYRGKLESAARTKNLDPNPARARPVPQEPPTAEPSVIVSHPEIVQQLYSKMNGSIKLVSTVNIELMELNQEQKSLTKKVLEGLPQLKRALTDATSQVTLTHEFGATVSGVAGSSDASLTDIQSLLAQITDDARKMDALTSTIDAISLQSDMLAFNATLEAAKAGEFGLAFSVIASEVRLLAQKCIVATQDLRALIHDISHRSNAHVENLNETQTSLSRLNELSTQFVTQVSSQLDSKQDELATLEFAEQAYKRIEHSIDKQLQLFKDINGALGLGDATPVETLTKSASVAELPVRENSQPPTALAANHEKPAASPSGKTDSDWALF
jgi:methyl-accepting chemotaxis protein